MIGSYALIIAYIVYSFYLHNCIECVYMFITNHTDVHCNPNPAYWEHTKQALAGIFLDTAVKGNAKFIANTNQI